MGQMSVSKTKTRRKRMAYYNEKERAKILRALETRTQQEVTRQYGISTATLHNWKVRAARSPVVETVNNGDELTMLRDYVARQVADEIRANGMSAAKKFFS